MRRIEYDDRGRVNDARSPVEISGEVIGETKAAWKFYDGSDICWLPKSQCEWNGTDTMEMPEWLAKEKGLI